MVSALVVVMTGGLVVANFGTIQMFGSSRASKAALMAAQGALDFTQLLLEHNRDLGRQRFTKETVNPVYGAMPSGIYQWVTAKEVAATSRLEGKFLNPDSSGESTFTVEIQNNLTNASPNGGIPPHAALVVVTGTSGGRQVELESMVLADPLYDASMVSNGALDLSKVDSWTVESNDPHRNLIRSRKSITCPAKLNSDLTATVKPSQGSLSFSKTGVYRDKGWLWAKDDIFLGDSSRNYDKSTDQEVADLQGITNSNFVPHSRRDYNIYDLKLTDLKTPTTPKVGIKPGGWRLERRNFQVGHDEPGEQGAVHKVWENMTVDVIINVDNSVSPPKERIYYDGGKTIPKDHYFEDGFEGVDGPVVPISQDGTSMVYSFDDNTFHVAAGANLEATTDFAVGVASVKDERPQANPTLLFHSDSEGKGGFIHGLGSIEFGGIVRGSGALAAHGNIRCIADSVDMKADSKSTGLVLWTEKDVELDAAGKPTLSFEGLIYSKGNISITNSASERIDTVRMRGALVAQSGSINLSDSAKVNMIYDPSYMQNMTNGLPGTRARLSRVSTRQR